MRLPLRQIPNLISSLRILLIVPIALTLASHQYAQTLWLFAMAAGSDAVDGFLAKHFGWQTVLGAILDPVADKLMLSTVFVMLAWLALIPVWLTATVVARDLVIVLGAAAFRVRFGALEMEPSVISKLNTLCQITFVLAVIGRESFSLSPALIVVLGASTFVTAVISGIDYVLVWGARALHQAASRRGARRRPT